jgi:hypothetical protein
MAPIAAISHLGMAPAAPAGEKKRCQKLDAFMPKTGYFLRGIRDFLFFQTTNPLKSGLSEHFQAGKP